MSNLSVGQIIMDAQRMASRVKDLDALGTALLEEAETNNRLVESLRQYQDDIESLNRISNNKTNADMVNRIQQQNISSSEILKENRELKVCIEDYERAMELMMQKYREHAVSKVLDCKINFKELYNERLWQVIRDQREKIQEMAAVMQRAVTVDEEAIERELQTVSQLRMENQALRDLLQISKQYGSAQRPIRENDHLLEEKAVQTDNIQHAADDSADDLSISGASVENINNNSVIQVYSTSPETVKSSNATTTTTATATAAPPGTESQTAAVIAETNTTTPNTNGIANENNNGPVDIATTANGAMEQAASSKAQQGSPPSTSEVIDETVANVTSATTASGGPAVGAVGAT